MGRVAGDGRGCRVERHGRVDNGSDVACGMALGATWHVHAERAGTVAAWAGYHRKKNKRKEKKEKRKEEK